MKGIVKTGLVTMLTAVILAVVLWALGFSTTVSFRPTVKAQSLSPVYLPLVMKNYVGVTDVRLESDRSFCSSLTVVGELKNYAATYYTPGAITVNLYDTEGVVVSECDTYPLAYSLAPGGVTAFSCLFYCLPTREWSYYTVDFSPYETSIRPLNLVVSGVTLQDNGRRLLVQGMVTNEDTEIANYPIVWVTLYDAVGDVVNVGRDSLPVSELYPGEHSVFSIEVCGPVASYTDYAVRAFAHSWAAASQKEPYRKAWQEWRVSQGE